MLHWLAIGVPAVVAEAMGGMVGKVTPGEEAVVRAGLLMGIQLTVGL